MWQIWPETGELFAKCSNDLSNLISNVYFLFLLFRVQIIHQR